jgi:hypothetical protein
MDQFLEGFEHTPGPRVDVFPKHDGEFVQIWALDRSKGVIKSYHRTPKGKITGLHLREFLHDGPFKMKDTFEDHRTTYYYHDHGPPDFAKRYEERISDGRLLIDDKRAGLQIERIWTKDFDFKRLKPKGRPMGDRAVFKAHDTDSTFYIFRLSD